MTQLSVEKKKLRAAIIGSGNIGTDILLKLQKSSNIICTFFIGRSKDSKGIKIAEKLKVRISTDGIEALKKYPDNYDIVFDATSALDHVKHAAILKELKKQTINLTPAKTGKYCVPSINLSEMAHEENLNMVTCGGQASIPILYAISKVHKIKYAEVISSISSKSAGAATRANIDEYLQTTELAIKQFTGCSEAKAILNINPAVPEVDMKTTIMATIETPNLDKIQKEISKISEQIKRYVPGYEIIVPPFIKENQVIVIVKVRGAGDYLPQYAGNLDIITSAAVAIAEYLAKKGHTVCKI